MCQTAFALVPACDEHGVPSRLSGRWSTYRKSSMSPSALTREPETGFSELWAGSAFVAAVFPPSRLLARVPRIPKLHREVSNPSSATWASARFGSRLKAL
jgi:hypothetical protein